jgi:hypothetical protein
MKSQVRLLSSPARQSRPAVAVLAVMGLATAILAIAPQRTNAREVHREVHSQGMHGYGHAAGPHAGAARAMRTDWHGGAGVRVAPGFHGGYGVGWHGDGRWEHGWHGGHFGWWYIDAGVWSAYPYYGYPYGYYPSYGYQAPYAYAPPESAVTYNNLPPQQQTWYYCDAARAYYPAVQGCPGGWRPVTPQAAPPRSAPPPPPPGAAAPQ